MTHEFDLVRTLSTGVADRTGAWDFIRGFAAHWTTPLGEGDGWGEAELVAAEERLGVRLPLALREAYQLFGRRRDLSSNHAVLLDPAQLYVDPAREALVFRHENQGAASWGIRLADLDQDDPAVVIRADLADKSAEKWESWLDRLSLTCLEIVLSESLHAPEGLCDFLSDLDQDGIDVLEQGCTRLPFPTCPVGEEEPGVRWFLGTDVLLRNDDDEVLLVRARTESALERVRELIPGDWLNDYWQADNPAARSCEQ
ncbi:SMI1/KNR4 family protein [Streptomyces sp. NPDC056682]|uniref:SMI1/KNR4 family protein n=1 Tax=Streptomyces sp. NPDC056682 TaxID=3345909 RepID=UPI0036C13D1E